MREGIKQAVFCCFSSRFSLGLVLGLISVDINDLTAAHFEYHRSSVDCSILVRDLVLTDRIIEDDDEIGVFTEAGLCAGSSVIELEEFYFTSTGVAAWGDDTIVDDTTGFLPGETITYKFWDQSLDEEIDLTVSAIVRGSELWQNQGYNIVFLSGGGEVFETQPTENVHNIVCTNFKIFDDPEVIGAPNAFDQIGILTPQGEVAGIMIWNAEVEKCQGFAFGDDPDTEEVEGFEEGDEFRFRLWQRGMEEDEMRELTYEVTDGAESFSLDRDAFSEVSLWTGQYLVRDEVQISDKFGLVQFSPNPFNGMGTIKFTLNSNSDVVLSLFDSAGRMIRKDHLGMKSSGINMIPVSFAGYPSGNYYIEILTNSGVLVAQGLLIR